MTITTVAQLDEHIIMVRNNSQHVPYTWYMEEVEPYLAHMSRERARMVKHHRAGKQYSVSV